MKLMSRITFPAAVIAAVTAGSLNFSREPVETISIEPLPSRDTVIYPTDSYKKHRIADLDVAFHLDSLYANDDTLGTNVKDTATVAPIVRDSAYIADSIAKFKAWYDSLSPRERRKYDAEKNLPIKMKQMDSLRKAKEEEKIRHDSIIEYTPRILEAYAIPDSMQYKRVISWTIDQDFGKLDISEPDTSYRYHFYDEVPFQRNDVNANWLGMTGSPAMYYNYFLRKSDEGVEFYDALESWSYSPRTIRQYNTKTPFTELAYYGTLLSTRSKEADNLHLFTTQNITPAFNFSILFNRFGGEGILNREKNVNNTFALQTNYLGKRYTNNFGYIRDAVNREENGGLESTYWVRDTSLDARDMKIMLNKAYSRTVKHTAYLDQEFSIPFSFIKKIKAKRDSTFVYDADELDRDITTAYIGHSSEFSIYTREYEDDLTEKELKYYRDIFYYNPVTSFDSLRVMKLDNKVYIKLQPWSADAALSKLNVGVGDLLLQYYDSTTVMPMNTTRNSIYVYGGVEGQIRNNVFWDARGRFYFAGDYIGNFDVNANAKMVLYPFRRAKKSPLTVGAHFETNLQTPTYYLEHIHTNHFRWDNSFQKISTTKIQGYVDIPHWKLKAEVGYALLANNIYYNENGIATQNTVPMSVFSASLRKEFALGPFHMDNRLLYQVSSNTDAVPVPTFAVNLKYFFQFWVKRNVMEMQIGVNGWWNTEWYSPAYNPNIGVFYNQKVNTYNNGPYFDIFLNAQWQRVTVFLKYQNFGNGWPMNRPDYFSADRQIVTQSGMDGLKLGVYWPFYIQPGKKGGHSHSHGSGSSASSSSGSSRSSGLLSGSGSSRQTRR